MCIRDRFYLIWPIIIFIFPIHKLWIPFSIIVLVNLIFRAYYDTFLIHEHHTISCIGDMTIGAIGAWLINISENFKKQIETLSKSKIAAIYFIFITLFFFRQELLFSHYGIRIFERMIFAFIILLIILEQTFSHNSFFKMSNFKTISKLGGITYGLYCLHFVGILITISITKKLALNTHLWQVFLLDTSIALLLTIIISKISYTYFESPFLKLKDKYSIITK